MPDPPPNAPSPFHLPPLPARDERRDNPLHLPIFTHVPSIVHNLLHSHYFRPEDWARWFDFYELSNRHGITCDLFRNVEYLYAEKELDLRPGLDVLDIGTGQSVFPCYLRRQVEADFVILDLDNYGFESQRTYFGDAGVPAPRLVQGDATQPPFAPQSFDRIVAVSAIEHFPDDGDIRFMQRAWTLLRPGGLCVITTPYASTYQENPDVHHYHGGFERRYNHEALQERLWSSGPWQVERELYLQPADTPLARKLTLRHGRLDNFFDEWYNTRSNLRYSHDSLWYTLLLLELSNTPGTGCLGTCFTLRRGEV